jgi:hypothetical protein
MGFIALAALDFRATREMYHVESRTSSLLAKGAMPMANVLVVGLLIRHRRPRSRRFLSGFVVSGAMALAVYVVMTLFVIKFKNQDLLNIYIWYIHKEFFLPQGTLRSLQDYPWTYFLAVAVWFSLPQLAVALVGGLFFHAFGNRRTARPNRC